MYVFLVAVKIAKGEEPIVDVKVNSRVKVLHSEVGVQGQLTIGGHRTGFHGSADANILGQKANVHADLLNIHKNPNDTHHQHESAIKKLKELINKKKNQNEVVNGDQYIENEYPSGGQNVYYLPEEQNYPQYREVYQPNVVSDVQNVANDRGYPVYIPTGNAQDLADYYKYGAPGSPSMYVDNEGRYVREDTFWQQEDNYKTNPKYLAAVEDGDYSGLIDILVFLVALIATSHCFFLTQIGKGVAGLAGNVVQGAGSVVEGAGNVVYQGGKTVVNGAGQTVVGAANVVGQGGAAVAQGAGVVVKETGKVVEKVADKTGKVITGQEPLANLNIDTKVKILGNEVGIKGGVKLGVGKQLGAHAGVNANILGQKANVNAGILNSSPNRHTKIIVQEKNVIPEETLEKLSIFKLIKNLMIVRLMTQMQAVVENLGPHNKLGSSIKAIKVLNVFGFANTEKRKRFYKKESIPSKIKKQQNCESYEELAKKKD
ncbi:unnamed protein product [Diabrotica balteata]|uniref:Uncharacterized protein n=1 Tax=Diabrotica balteata TaxID=107213 RepID=A0A9N9T023_DIABA|nr:unnamed protein product [Diabrotica balteata]